MILGLFGRRFSDPTAALYRAIVTEARHPEFYIGYGVPDTVGARFDMLVLHLALVLRRLRGEGDPQSRGERGGEADPGERARELADFFFREMDRALREMGVGDVAVPKRMRKLAAAWNGRSLAYDRALAEGRIDDLAAALARNVFAEAADADRAAAALARHVVAAAEALAALPLADLLAGRIVWPDPARYSTRMPT
jgi:cytochrome b pre-mRNA-processing protein 3